MTFAAAKPVLVGAADAYLGTASQAEPTTTTARAKVSFSSIKQIDVGVLNVGYAEDGPVDAPSVILLPGWPYDIHTYDALETDKAIVAGCDWGARTAAIVAALWPERCKALVSVSGYLIGSRESNEKPLPPQAELQWWYQFYFATERGRAGYEAPIAATLRG